MEREVRVRFAPSPTGALHIGGVRTALYNYIFARQHNGKMLLRIEDTDSARFVPEAENYIIKALKWLGIEIDEGVGVEDAAKNPYGPYRQSERRDIYHIYVQQLIDNQKAYYAFDTPAELDRRRAESPNFQYDATSRMQMTNSLTLPKEDVEARIARGEQYVVRFLVEPDEDICVHDLIRGDVIINSSILDDKVLYKSADDLPTYHLANIVDDHLMRISHVIRGEEWLPSSPLHVLLYRAFGWEDTMPQFAHLPLLLKPDGNGKLSKRDGDRLGFPVFPLNFYNSKDGTTSSGYREDGYYPEAVINFLALLGWHPNGDKEIYSMQELIAEFSLERVSKSGARFDYEKAKWFNHQYLMQKSVEEICKEFLQILPSEKRLIVQKLPFEKICTIVDLVRERVSFVKDLWGECNYFFEAPVEYDEKSVKKRWKEDSCKHLQALSALLLKQEDWSKENLDNVVLPWIEEQGYGVGIVMNAFRICLVGAARGPHIWDITSILGKEETIHRVQKALQILH